MTNLTISFLSQFVARIELAFTGITSRCPNVVPKSVFIPSLETFTGSPVFHVMLAMMSIVSLFLLLTDSIMHYKLHGIAHGVHMTLGNF